MVRALLDANVIISAAIRPSGVPGQIVTALLTRDAFDLVLSPAIVGEIERGLRRPKVRKYLLELEEALLWLADLVALADLVRDTGKVVGVCRDPADDVILAAALEGRADVIVTGDEDLLALEDHDGITILTPRAFLDVIRTANP